MGTSRVQQTQDGQELEQADLAIIATESAHADDYVLAELLRLAPYNGTSVAKCIVPYGVSGSNGAMVRPNGATGAALVTPFRMVAGSRVGPGTTSTDAVDASGAMLNWRDIRSAIYSVSDDNATLGHAVSFSANSSGNSRIDIVVATIQCDQNGATVQRFVQPPNSAPPTTTTGVVGTIVPIISVSVVTGTPGTSPSPPATPADTLGASGTFNVVLAMVQIPNGFNGTSTLGTNQILEIAPVVPIAACWGADVVAPPTSLSSSLPAAAISAWGATATRPTAFMPTTMTGGRRMPILFDATTASPLIGDAAVLDNSIDWRNRYFTVTAYVIPGASQFVSQHNAAGAAIPMAGATGVLSLTQPGQSFFDDSQIHMGLVSSRNAGVVFFANGGTWSAIAAGSNGIGLYVDLSTGALKVYYQGTPGVLFYFKLEAFGAYDNP